MDFVMTKVNICNITKILLYYIAYTTNGNFEFTINRWVLVP